MAGGDVIRNLADILIIAFVAFALVLEVVLHKVEHWILEKAPHIQIILRNLYRELMILGMISFGFIMYLFTNNPTYDFKMTFEVAHVFVFLFAIFHSIMVALAVFIALNLSSRWKQFERMDLVKYLEKKEEYRTLVEKRESKQNPIWQHFGLWIFSPLRLFKYNKLHEIMAFHDIRWQFIYYRNLQPDFKFSKFLRKVMMVTFIELVEIHPLNWLFFIIVIGLDLVRLKIGSHRNFDSYFFISHSIFTVLAITLLAVKIHRVYERMTKNPATYYDTVNPHAFRAELSIVEEEERVRRGKIGGGSVRESEDRGSDSRSHDSEAHHNPIYHNMALKPDDHGHGDLHGQATHALDLRKQNTDNNQRTGKDAAEKLLEAAKQCADDKGDVQLDMLAVMPKTELELRKYPARTADQDNFWETIGDPNEMKHMTTARRNLRMEALRRLRERKNRNAAIVETAQDVQVARRASPKRNYPRWLVKLFPRLGRVASAAEKLFWFGWPRFYLFCIETLMMFQNINLAASLAKLIFWYKEMGEYVEQENKAAKAAKQVGKVSKMLLEETVRAAKEKVKQRKPEEDLVYLWISLALAVIACAYVLLSVARIMRKYIFVLNNANLLPESMTITTIRTVNLKDMMNAETMHDGSGRPIGVYYDSETDVGEEDDGADMRQLRSKMSTYFHKELTEKSPKSPSGVEF